MNSNNGGHYKAKKKLSQLFTFSAKIATLHFLIKEIDHPWIRFSEIQQLFLEIRTLCFEKLVRHIM